MGEYTKAVRRHDHDRQSEFGRKVPHLPVVCKRGSPAADTFHQEGVIRAALGDGPAENGRWVDAATFLPCGPRGCHGGFETRVDQGGWPAALPSSIASSPGAVPPDASGLRPAPEAGRNETRRE